MNKKAGEVLNDVFKAYGKVGLQISSKLSYSAAYARDSGDKAYPGGVVVIRKGENLDIGVGAMLLELLRAKHYKKYEAIEEKARKGELSREAYVVEQEKWGFELVQEQRRIALEGINAKVWQDKSAYRVFADFDTYYKFQNNPANFESKKAHTEAFRETWDMLYKDIWEAKNKKK